MSIPLNKSTIRILGMILALGLLLAFGIPLRADTVKLKNGKVLENVKSKIEKDSVSVKYENGKTESFPKTGISSIKVAAVDWKKKEAPPVPQNLDAKAQEEARKLAEQEAQKEAEEERLRVAEASATGAEWTPRSEEELISPWGNFALGLIPGYSGLYRTKNNWGGGTFTFLETIALLGVADAYGAKRVQGSPFSEGYLGFSYFALQPGVQGTLIGNAILFQGFQTYGYEGGVTGQKISEIGGAPDSEGVLTKEQSRRAAVLGFILLADGIASYFSANAWNQGTFGGDKDPNFVRPTRPGERLFRSMFFPGWGQVYGGNNIKGYSWMAGAIGLLANAGSKETAVTDEKRSLTKSSAGNSTTIPFLVGNLPSITNDTGTNSALYTFLLQSPEYAKLETAVQERNQAWSMYGGFWALNLIDAYFFSGKREEAKVSFVPNFNFQPVGVWGGRVQMESFTSLALEFKYD